MAPRSWGGPKVWGELRGLEMVQIGRRTRQVGLVCTVLCISRVGPATTSDPDFTSVIQRYLSTDQTLTTSSMGRRTLKTENIRSTFLMMFALSEVISGPTTIPPMSQLFFKHVLIRASACLPTKLDSAEVGQTFDAVRLSLFALLWLTLGIPMITTTGTPLDSIGFSSHYYRLLQACISVRYATSTSIHLLNPRLPTLMNGPLLL